MAVKISELKREIGQLRSIGAQLANMAYNWGQESAGEVVLGKDDKKTLRELQKKWDAIERSCPPLKRSK